MNSLVKSLTYALMLSLAIATTASATQPNSLENNAANSINSTESQGLIAQQYPPGLLKETRSRRFVDKMIMLHMEMVAAAEDALQSSDPEVKKMAQEAIKTSNAEIGRLMEMRKKRFSVSDD